MIKLFIALIMVAGISGCATTPDPVAVRTKNVVVMPSESQLRCPDLPPVPENIDTMTDVDVADYILELYKTGRMCKGSLEGVKQFLLEAQKITRETNNDE